MACPIHCLCLPTGHNRCGVEPINDGVYFAVPTTPTDIGVWSFQSVKSSPLNLTGHRKPINSLCFGCSAKPKLLCSAATDYVIVWNLQKARERFAKGERVTGQIIGTTLGEVTHCCFNKDDSVVAACVDTKVFVLKSSCQSIIAELDGHSACVTKAEFCPHYSSTLVTISDDRTFKVWDIQALTIVYESAIITSSSLISLAMSWIDPHMSVGSTDGILRTYDLTDGNNFRELYQVDVTKAVAKQRDKQSSLKNVKTKSGTVTITAKRGMWKKPETDSVEPESISQQGQAVINLTFCSAPVTDKKSDIAPQFAKSAANDIIENSSPILVVSTTGAILQFNARTLEPIDFIDLHEPMPSHFADMSTYTINTTELSSVRQSPGTTVLWAVLGTMFNNEFNIVQFGLSESHAANQRETDLDLTYVITGVDILRTDDDESSDLSMIAVTPLCDKSPLKSEMLPQTSPEPAKPKAIKTPGYDKKKKIDPMNQPLTFKPKVRSSGYSQSPMTTMFKPKINKPKSTQTVKKGSVNSSNMFDTEYPMDSEPPSDFQDAINVAEKATTVNKVVFSDDGRSIACALGNKTATLFKVPLSLKTSRVYVGHSGNVNSVSWARNSNMVITASDDKTAAIWVKGSSEPIMKFETVANNNNNGKEQKNMDRTTNSAFSKEIKQAQFFYMDKFVLLASGGTMYLYKYLLDPEKDEIRRYLTKSRYKLVKNWTTQSVTITSMAAVNAFHSHLVLCAGSNRDIDIFDLNRGEVAMTFTDSHSRPAHSLCINKGSGFASQTPSAYNLFASAAPADAVKLWDARSRRCVQRLEGHVNNAHGCGLAVSPCGRYLATGSEDRLVYVYDLRVGTYCRRLKGNSDVVTDVTFHPARPMLVSGSLDGTVVSYASD